MASSPTGSAPGMVLAPQFIAHRYSSSQDAIGFRDVPRDVRRRVPFVIDEELGGAVEPLFFPRAQAMTVAPAPAPMHFIFHSAFCCSTLLANAFDVPGISTSLKEAMILNDLIGWRRRNDAVLLPEVVRDVLHLLARPFERGEAVVNKPSNLINELAPLMMAQLPDARAIFIEAPMREFVTSIAGKGIDGRLWVRRLLVQLLHADLVHLGIAGNDYLMLTDLQVAAVAWLAQHQLFAELTRRAPDRYRWITSRALLAAPARALGAAYAFYGIDTPPGTVERVVAQVFARNAKDGRAFTAQDRAADQARAGAGYTDEIDKVVVWAETLADSLKLPLGSLHLLLTG